VADVFISYARSTVDLAGTITQLLESAGFSVWIDHQLPPHRDYSIVIEEQLRSAKAVLVLWSTDAISSRWVPAEADVAHAAGTLVQLSLDGSKPPLPFNRLQCDDLSGWAGEPQSKEWQKVVASVAELVGRSVKRTQTESLAPQERLLAVLAFDNISGDPEVTYFSDGVSEEIQQTVAQGSDLRVVARSSSFQFRGADKAVRNVASELKATHLLDGSVRRSGNRVRISAQLVECVGETTLWASRFDGDLSDVFALQDHIAQAVAQALKITLTAPTSTHIIDPQTYELFLKARGILTEGNRLYDASTAATSLLEQVVKAVPDHAAAWELLANARAWTLRWGLWQGDYVDGRNKVIEASKVALQLDPKRGGGFLALATIEPWGAYGVREALLNKAQAVSPNDPSVLIELSTFFWSVGRFREALRFAEQASELNPLMPAARLHMAQMRAYVGDYEASIRMHRELYERWPRNFAILFSLLNSAATFGFWSDFDALVGDVRFFNGREAAVFKVSLKWVEALRAGDGNQRRQLLDRYTQMAIRDGAVPLNYLEALSQLGMTEEALDLAETTSFEHMFRSDGPMPSGVFPGTVLGRWSDLNKSPRFVDLCDRLGLCAYWVQSERWPDCVDWTPYDFRAEVHSRASSRRSIN